MSYTTKKKLSKRERKARLKHYIQDHYLPDGSFNYGAYHKYEKMHERRKVECLASSQVVSHKTPESLKHLRDVISAYEFGTFLLDKVQQHAETNNRKNNGTAHRRPVKPRPTGT